MAAHWRSHAGRRRGYRLSDRCPPPRPAHGVGVPDGRQRCLAARQPGRPSGRLCHARCRRDVAAPGPRPAVRTGLVHGQAPGHGSRRPRTGGGVLRHHRRRTLGQRRRGRELALHRAQPAANLRGERGAPRLMVIGRSGDTHADPHRDAALLLHRTARICRSPWRQHR
ncbi:conserved protein of unknown function (plasmid) [Cupriavidus neocaledonicus]|uniref:Uncharacterized protein n=1 Tax=Cupriavidus neocaledonicus TaxID=1040979 RepID=A0A375HPV8_9BURK|nr:conserved hypothetical protein [Cupriavidus neocaledonicus]SPD58884.1 conserved protein of unknown function [Cupriavidus neocaledonicus]